MTTAPERETASDLRDELQALRAFSARIGAQSELIQAAGGNTSLKVADTLYIKASGCWLRDASNKDIMVSVYLQPLLEAIEQGLPVADEPHRFLSGPPRPGLRPSIETSVHALMPQRVVAHVHCVDTIALAVREAPHDELVARLKGLNWAFIPYKRPGLPLARAIAIRKAQRPDVLILANHGLVVAAETVADTERLLDDVRSRLRQTARPSFSADTATLLAIAGAYYDLPEDAATHSVATDPTSCAIASGGPLYPDHVIFLGASTAIAKAGETAEEICARLGSQPVLLLFPGIGVLLRKDASAGAKAMARCLADVASRLKADSYLRYLSENEAFELTNWDAEKHRMTLDLATRSGA